MTDGSRTWLRARSCADGSGMIQAVGGVLSQIQAELSQMTELLSELRTIARKGPLTLLFAARDELHNEAVVLRDVLMR